MAGDVLVAKLIGAMLNARGALWKQYWRLHDLVVKLVAGQELCRHLYRFRASGCVTKPYRSQLHEAMTATV